MDATPTSTKTLTIPNALTIARIFAVPAFVLAIHFIAPPTGRLIALTLFIAAAATDWLDGHLARRLNQQSRLGQMLDPIADKLIVAAALTMLIAHRDIADLHVLAAIIILSREILVSGLREFLAGLDVSLPVTRLAKWKTGVQMAAIALLLAGPALSPRGEWLADIGLALLWLAALVTIYTGSAYVRAGLVHVRGPKSGRPR